jgi:PGAP1-like protein
MAKNRIDPPFYPIIYVRGYAGTDDEVEDTVSDPYMGFNLGSTRIRTVWTGETERFYFESPLVRLMKDFQYRDVYSAGLNTADIDEMPPGSMEPRSIVIYRYYDLVSSVFGAGKQVAMEDFGKGLNKLIFKLRDRICSDEADRSEFRVYLVGHSMGGLVIRCFLQNESVGEEAARKLVDKVFTYATPHNGIDLDILGNVPAFFTYHSADNFNRTRMRQYLGLPEGAEPVNTLNDKFQADRFFCLVGTNAKTTPSRGAGRRESLVHSATVLFASTMQCWLIGQTLKESLGWPHARTCTAATPVTTASLIRKKATRTSLVFFLETCALMAC